MLSCGDADGLDKEKEDGVEESGDVEVDEERKEEEVLVLTDERGGIDLSKGDELVEEERAVEEAIGGGEGDDQREIEAVEVVEEREKIQDPEVVDVRSDHNEEENGESEDSEMVQVRLDHSEEERREVRDSGLVKVLSDQDEEGDVEIEDSEMVKAVFDESDGERRESEDSEMVKMDGSETAEEIEEREMKDEEGRDSIDLAVEDGELEEAADGDVEIVTMELARETPVSPVDQKGDEMSLTESDVEERINEQVASMVDSNRKELLNDLRNFEMQEAAESLVDLVLLAAVAEVESRSLEDGLEEQKSNGAGMSPEVEYHKTFVVKELEKEEPASQEQGFAGHFQGDVEVVEQQDKPEEVVLLSPTSEDRVLSQHFAKDEYRHQETRTRCSELAFEPQAESEEEAQLEVKLVSSPDRAALEPRLISSGFEVSTRKEYEPDISVPSLTEGAMFRSELEPEVEPSGEPQLETELELEVEPPRLEPGFEPRVKRQLELEVKPRVKRQLVIEVEPSDVESELELNLEHQVDLEVEPPHVEPELEPSVEHQAEFEVEPPHMGLGFEPRVEHQAELEVEPPHLDPGFEPRVKRQLELEVEPRVAPALRSSFEYQQDHLKSDSESTLERDTTSEPEHQLETNQGTDFASCGSVDTETDREDVEVFDAEPAAQLDAHLGPKSMNLSTATLLESEVHTDSDLPPSDTSSVARRSMSPAWSGASGGGVKSIFLRAVEKRASDPAIADLEQQLDAWRDQLVSNRKRLEQAASPGSNVNGASPVGQESLMQQQIQLQQALMEQMEKNITTLKAKRSSSSEPISSPSNGALTSSVSISSFERVTTPAHVAPRIVRQRDQHRDAAKPIFDSRVHLPGGAASATSNASESPSAVSPPNSVTGQPSARAARMAARAERRSESARSDEV